MSILSLTNHPYAQMYGNGPTFMDVFDRDEHATMQEDNIYYPWTSWPEWELASFLLCSSFNMAAVDNFLSLDPMSLIILLI